MCAQATLCDSYGVEDCWGVERLPSILGKELFILTYTSCHMAAMLCTGIGFIPVMLSPPTTWQPFYVHCAGRL